MFSLVAQFSLGCHYHLQRFCTLDRRIDSTVHRKSDRLSNELNLTISHCRRDAFGNKGRNDSINVLLDRFYPIEKKEAFKQTVKNQKFFQ